MSDKKGISFEIESGPPKRPPPRFLNRTAETAARPRMGGSPPLPSRSSLSATTPAPSNSDTVKYRMGQPVEVRKNGDAKWLPARIVSSRANDTYDVMFEDKSQEKGVPNRLIRAANSGSTTSSASSAARQEEQRSSGGSLREGDTVEGNYRGKGRWYTGRVRRVHRDGTMDIDYDDGEHETQVEPALVRSLQKSGGGMDHSPPRSTRLEEGTKVEGNYRGKGRWYPGVISRVNADGSFNVDYDDGEKETRLEASLVRSLGGASAASSGISRSLVKNSRMQEGDKVEGNYRGKGRWYAGRISRINADGTFNVDYDDGEKETRLEASLVRAVGGIAGGGGLARSPDRVSPRGARLEEGTKVEGNYRGKGKWYPGVIRRVNADGSFNVDYDDGEKELRLDPSLVRAVGGASATPSRVSHSPVKAARLEEGAKVEGNYRGKGKWYPGVIRRVNADGSFNVDYDDGEKELRLDASLVRAVGGSLSMSLSRPDRSRSPVRAARLDEGSKVEGNYRGMGRWYPGVISRVNADGSFNVNYDDGEKETRLEPSLVRAVGGSTASPSKRVRSPEPAARLELGAKIEANYRNRGTWYPGKIAKVNSDGTFNIDYDNYQREVYVIAELVRPVGAAAVARGGRSKSPERGSVRLSEGSKVEGNYRGMGRWYPGRISRVNADGSFNVDYDDGEKETRLEASLVRTLGGSSASTASRRDFSPVRGAKLEVGSKVEGNYRGVGKWYPGKISRVNLDGSFNIDYDDGEKETRVVAELVRAIGGGSSGGLSHSPVKAARLEEGAKVEGNYRGKGKWYPGVIRRVNADGSFNVDYDDGEKELRLDASLVRAVGGGLSMSLSRPDRSRSPVRAARLQEGDNVEGNYRGKGKWYPGRISRAHADGTFNVDYDDGEKELRLEPALVRAAGGAAASFGGRSRSPVREAKLEVGSKVEGNYRGVGKWYPGKISRVNLDGSFNIDYDDGEKETRVAASLVRAIGGASSGGLAHSPVKAARLDVGSKIEGNYRRRGAWLPGRITKVNSDGSFNVEYDDGQKDIYVDPADVRAVASRTARSPSPSRLDVGTKVEGNYRGKGKWYPGRIAKVNVDGTFNVDYDDGERETYLSASLVRAIGGAGRSRSPVRPVRLQEGDKVEGNYRGKGKWYPGRISRVNADGTFNIDYDDGEKETRLEESLIRVVGGASASTPGRRSRSPARETKLEVGSKVEGNYRGVGKWYPGRISRVNLDGSFNIDYDDGEKETRVPASLVRALGGAAAGRSSRSRSPRPARLEEGTKVEGNYRGKGKWYPGKISRVNADGSFNVDYDDGEKELRLDPSLVRAVGGAAAPAFGGRSRSPVRAARLQEGDNVEGNYRGKGRWYPGVISRAHLDGTFNVDYDDGEKETRLEAALIRAVGAAAAGGARLGRSRSPVRAARLEEGTKVEGNYRGVGKWYPGKISRVNLDGSFNIDYDDGEKETRVPAALVRAVGGVGRSSRSRSPRPPRLEEGTKVEGNYRGKGRWYPGVISRVNADGSFNVDYDDGEKETRLEASLVRVIGGSDALRSSIRSPVRPVRLEVGSKVEGNYRGRGKWYPGTIMRVNSDGSFNIDYDDGEKEVYVDASLVRAAPVKGGRSRSPVREAKLEVGSKVEGNYRGVGKWYPGKISRVNLDGSFNIDYDDGEKETRVAASLIRAIGGGESGARPGRSRSPVRSARLQEGDKVEGNYRGKGKWYPGRISRINADGTFNVDYDDGEKEMRLEPGLVRPIGGAATLSSSLGRRSGSPVRTSRMEEGTKVEGNYRGKGRWYPGRISRVNLDGTFNVDYDDGEKETRLEAAMIRPIGGSSSGAGGRSRSPVRGGRSRSPVRAARLEEGAKVEGNYRGAGRWYPGKISRVNLDGSFNIDYDDGETESRVDASLIRVLGGAKGGGRSRSPVRAAQFREGDKVEGDYRGKGKWYPGRISKENLDGTYNIDYDDGEKETRVDAALIRLLGGASRPARSHSPLRLDEGSKVEGNYRGMGRWQAGVVNRCRLDGTFDVRYDNGDQETQVTSQNIRPLKSAVSSFAERDHVDGNYRGKGRWLPATITKLRLDGSFDLEYDDGEVEQRVPADCVRRRRSEDDLLQKRDGHLKKVSEGGSVHSSKHRQGAKVACYWYRPTKFGSARLNKKPKAAIVMRFNADGTYTVEIVEDHSVLDDVEEKYLKTWAEGTNDLESESKASDHDVHDTKSLDKWVAVFKMAHNYVKQKKSHHNVPAPANLLTASFPTAMDKLENILGNEVIHDFRKTFDRADRHRDGELTLDRALDGYEDMGARIGQSELRAWLKNNAPRMSLNLSDYILAYANLIFPSDQDFKGLLKQEQSDSLGRTLRLAGEDRDMAAFAHTFGKKQLRELENAFDTLAVKSAGEDAKLLVRDVIEAFLSMGRAITVSRLQEWMTEAGVTPRDRLTLADFAAVFAYFFSPSRESSTHNTILSGTQSALGMTLAEVAVQVLQEEKWHGSADQASLLVRRLCAGRSDQTIECVGKIRAAFEAQDENNTGEVSASAIADIFTEAQIPVSVVSSTIDRFRSVLKQQGRGRFSLPEVFEHFGSRIQEFAESSVSVAEAFSMLSLHCTAAEVRMAADLARDIIDGVLRHPADSKYWQIVVTKAEFQGKIWKFDAGKMLMKAIGFAPDPLVIPSKDGSMRHVVGLQGLPGDLSKVPKLPSELLNRLATKRAELEQQIVALEGAPSVAAAVREMRAHHSLNEVRNGIETALSIVRNVLMQPKDLNKYRVKKANPTFLRSLGYMQGSNLLMNAIGYAGSASSNKADDENVAAYVLKSVNPASTEKFGKGIDGAFGSTADLGASGTANFKFPYMDAETEQFLYRRKADLETAARLLDREESNVDFSKSGTVALADTAHASNLTTKELTSRATAGKSPARARPSSAPAAKGTSRPTTPSRTGTLKGKTATVKEAPTVNFEDTIPHAQVAHLKTFLNGATAAQKAQITMIRNVFETMDADKDGLLSMNDVRAYFRAKGRYANDLAVRKWITARDIDQDGAVSLSEFVASCALQLDPASRFVGADGRLSDAPNPSSTIAQAFGALRLGGTGLETIAACEAIDEYVRRILDSPGVKSFWSISINEENFSRRIGRLFGGVKMMQALGFVIESNGTVLALRDPKGKEWDVVPQPVRIELNQKLEELNSHKTLLLEPTISNIAAVSAALGSLGDSFAKRQDWAAAVETMLTIVNNILKYPRDAKYYNINTQNPNFHQKVGRVPGSLDVLRSVGFEETEAGSLVMPLEADLVILQARKLEMEVGLNLLRERVEEDKARALEESASAESKTESRPATAGAKGSAKDAKASTFSKPASKIPTAVKAPAEGSAVKGANKDAVQEEKARRIKAEVALHHQKAAMHELQGQLFDLKEAEAKQLSYRYEATINRLPEDEQARMQKQVQAIGKETAGQKSLTITTPLPAGKASKTAALTPPKAVEFTTTLSSAVSVGETRLPVTGQDGMKKGMKLVIGSGTRMEIRTLTGFGSLVIDQGLSFAHPAGTVITACVSNSKNNFRIEKTLASEFCRGLLYEEVIPEVCAHVESVALQQQLNALYFQRPMLKHSYTLRTLPAVRLSEEPCSAVAFAPEVGRMFATAGGRVHSFDFSLSSVAAVGLFEVLANPSVNERWASDAIDEVTASKDELVSHINGDPALRGGFQLLAESQQAASIEELLQRAAHAAEGTVTWKAYFQLLQNRPVVRKSVLSLELLGYQGDLDSYSFSLLLKVFDCFDCDEDECVTDSEVRAIFAELDGCLPEVAVFYESVAAVLGSEQTDLKLSFKEFLSVRESYAKKTETLVAGMFLHGKICVKQGVDGLTSGDKNAQISPLELSRTLASGIAFKQILPRKMSLSLTLESDTRKRSASEIVNILDAELTFAGQTVRSQRLVPSGSSAVAQVLLDYTGEMVYALADNGVVTAYESRSGNRLFEQRVMWAEPMSARAVEGNEKFSKWRKDSGLEHDRNTPDMHLNSLECVRVSSLMARFSLSLPAAAGSTCTMAIDPATGLMAVNCSILSGSICFYEPTSLKRIFRIKSPSKFTPEISDAIRGLGYGKVPRLDMFRTQNCAGALTRMEVNSRRCLIFCQIAGSHNVTVLSLLTGDAVMELTGHTDAITCFSTHIGSNLLFTGSEDRSVRVWKSAECIPAYLAVTGATGDANVRKLEHKITHSSTVGAGSSKVLRNVYAHMCARVRATPRWRRGVIVSFFDGQKHVLQAGAAHVMAGVEVVFENATVQMYSNPNMLRRVEEISRSPEGPPLWSEKPSILAVGQPVAVYDVDPDTVSVLLAREMGIVSNAAYTYENSKSLIQSLFPASVGFDPTDVVLALEAVGYQSTDDVVLTTFVQRLYKQQEKHFSMSDRLLVGNAAPILSVRLIESSKLLVAVDRSGCCCVWDPCSSRAFLSISDPLQQYPQAGSFPYALVACQNLTVGFTMADAVSPAISFELGAAVMPVSTCVSLPFPVSKACLTRAYHIDTTANAFQGSVVRGLVYVMKDFAFKHVETACFLPALVSMDSERSFLCSPSLLGSAGASNLQAIYKSKDSVLRIVYVVSRSHGDMKSLCVDLNKYGVFTRGYNSTPSDQIELICFERDAEWYARIQRASNTDLNAAVAVLRSTPAQRHHGIVLSRSSDSHGRRLYRVAQQFSSEVVTVPEAKIVAAVSKEIALADNFKPIATFSPLTGYAIGAAVEFTLDCKFPSSGDVGSVAELNCVTVRATNDLGEMGSYMIPIVFGRSSYPVPAGNIHEPVNENTQRCLSDSYVARVSVWVGRQSFAAHMKEKTLDKWTRSAQLLNSSLVKNLIMPAGDAVNESPVPFLSAFSSGKFAHFALQQMVAVLQQRVAPTHPFVTYLEGVLGHHGASLVAAHNHKDDTRKNADAVSWAETIDKYYQKWLSRSGVAVEELYQSEASSVVSDVEIIAYRLQSLLAAAHQSNRSVGPVLATMLPLLLNKTGLAGAGGAQGSSLDAAQPLSSISVSGNFLRLLLVQHQATVGLKSVTQIAGTIKRDSVEILSRELDLLMKPVTMAVKTAQSMSNFVPKRKEYLPRTDKPTGGQYSVSARISVDSIFPGIAMEIRTGTKSRGGEHYTERFLTWKLLNQDARSDADKSAAISHIPHVISALAREARVLRPLEGISFEAEADPPSMVLEWSEKWRTLQSVVQARGGLLNRNKLELFRLIASNLLDALMEVHASGAVLQALNPSTIVLEDNGSDVLLLFLPTARETVGDEGSASRAGRMAAAYQDHNNSNPVTRSCLARTDAESARFADLYPVQSDIWSFGACLFSAAFGCSPFEAAEGNMLDGRESVNQIAVTGTLMYQLLKPVMEKGKLNTNSAVKHTSAQFSAGVAVSEALKTVLAEQSKIILFSMVREYMECSMDNLTAFRARFCAESLTCGLTEWSTGALWEKIVQCVFIKVRGGMHEVNAVKDRIATLPKPLSEAVAQKFLFDQLGLDLSKLEVEALIASLTPGQNRDGPFVERVAKMFKMLSATLEEIFYYGLFQQLLFTISGCFSLDPMARPKLSDLRALALFDCHNEIALTKAGREAALLMSTYQNNSEFYRTVLFAPLQQSLERLIRASGSDSSVDGSAAWKVRSDLELFSTCLVRFEDLITGITSEAIGKVPTTGGALSKTGVSAEWMRANALDIANMALQQGYLQAVSLFLLRFLSTEYAKNLDLQQGTLTAKDTANLRGISLGSKLASRVSKFIQHMVNCVAAMSGLSVAHLAGHESTDRELSHRLQQRHTTDLLYNSTLSAVLMLYTGEESAVPFVGALSEDLSDAHPHFLPRDEDEDVMHSADSHWNTQMCKLFEPPLVDLVGEDGAGSHKVSLSIEMIKSADKLMATFVSTVGLSFPTVVHKTVVKPTICECNVQSRGSLYFVAMVRYVRSLCMLEAGSLKTLEKSQQNIISAVILLLPTPNAAALKPIEAPTEDAPAVSEHVPPYIPEGQWLQKVQVILDARCATRLQANFSSTDATTKISLLKLCQRALNLCLSLPGELMESEPFLSLGKDFTSAGWVSGISELLKSKVSNLDVSINALICLRLMSRRSAYMRAWSVFQLMPILCALSRYPGRDFGTLRAEAIATLKYATVNAPIATQALITMRVPHLESVQGMTHIMPATNMLIEANDISFGSTLAEQKRFAELALDWVNSLFPAEVPFSELTSHNFVATESNRWETLFDFATQVVSWVPKLCLALVVSDVQDAAKREKTHTSCDVARNQLLIVERILLYALASKHPAAPACVVKCLWAPSSSVENYESRDASVKSALALIESHTCGNGLIACMDQLTSTGTYIDTFLSLRLQFTIMQTVSRLMKYGDSNLLHLLCSCGVVRMVDKFLQGAFGAMKDVPRLSQQGLFARQYKEMFSCMRDVWSVLVGTRDSRVYEDILDLGIFQRLVHEWLPCSTNITFGTVDPDYNPMVVRSEAVRMLQTLVLHIPASDRLVAELIRALMADETVTKELANLKSASTKKGTAQMKRLAAEALCTLASINAEVLVQELMSKGVPKSLLDMSAHFGCSHISMPAVWVKWGQSAGTSHKEEKSTAEGGGGGDLTEGLDSPDDGFTLLDEDALAKVEQKVGGLTGVFDSNSAAVAQKMKELFDREEAEKKALAAKEQLNGLTGEELSTVIERMGQLVLGVKTLFDSKCAAKKTAVLAHDVPGMLLDLCLSSDVFIKARKALTDNNMEQVDFPKFLDIYCKFCGLTAPSYSKIPAKEGLLPHWVPSVDGVWVETTVEHANSIRKAAEPFSISAAVVNEQMPGSVFLLPPALRVLPRSDEEQGNVWVKGDDIVDILLIAGTSASEETVESAIQQLRNFLPGIISGKFCLQEVLAINEFHEVRGGSGSAPSASAVAKKPITNPLTSSVEFKANESRRQRISHSTWKLPFRETAQPISRAAIKEEFRRLDIIGEGRLTVLNLRSALQLREVQETEQNVRDWFKAHDRGEKGYIDFRDYEAIYEGSASSSKQHLASTMSQINDKPAGRVLGGTGDRASSVLSRTQPGDKTSTQNPTDKRAELMKIMFQRYDVDGDGRITVEDLHHAFTAQGKPFTAADLRTWVQTKDSTGTGAVSFEDFARHY